MCDHIKMQQSDLIRPLYSSTYTLIHYFKGEELALSSGVTPRANARLVGDSGSDSPPMGKKNKNESVLISD